MLEAENPGLWNFSGYYFTAKVIPEIALIQNQGVTAGCQFGCTEQRIRIGCQDNRNRYVPAAAVLLNLLFQPAGIGHRCIKVKLDGPQPRLTKNPADQCYSMLCLADNSVCAAQAGQISNASIACAKEQAA